MAHGGRAMKAQINRSSIAGNPPKRVITDTVLEVNEMKEIQPGIWVPVQIEKTSYLTEPPASQHKIATTADEFVVGSR